MARRNLSTLRNEMLYRRTLRRIRRIDPSFDEQLIDRELEPNEAIADLRRRGHLRGGQSEAMPPMKEYRNALFDMGIRHPSMQSFIMRQDNVRQEDLDLLAYIFGARPDRNWKLDIARKARPARSVRDYARNYNRSDIAGVDTPGSKFVKEWFM